MFGSLFKKRSEDIQAGEIYTYILRQSRKAEFYGANGFADDYNGRIDLLSINLSLVMINLYRFDKAGSVLAQALYDVMVDDFNIALREEGLADTGIKRRIKPMVRLFYARLADIKKALSSEPFHKALLAFTRSVLPDSVSDANVMAMADYIETSHEAFLKLNLQDFEAASFDYAPLLIQKS